MYLLIKAIQVDLGTEGLATCILAKNVLLFFLFLREKVQIVIREAQLMQTIMI